MHRFNKGGGGGGRGALTRRRRRSGFTFSTTNQPTDRDAKKIFINTVSEGNANVGEERTAYNFCKLLENSL